MILYHALPRLVLEHVDKQLAFIDHTATIVKKRFLSYIFFSSKIIIKEFKELWGREKSSSHRFNKGCI